MPEYADGLSERTHKAIRKTMIDKGNKDFNQQVLQEYKEEFVENLNELSKDDKLRERTKAARYNVDKKDKQNKPVTLSSTYRSNSQEILNLKVYEVLGEEDNE